MNVVQLSATTWRPFPHLITRRGRNNVRWRVDVRRDGAPDDREVYSYVGAHLLDGAGRVTAAGRAAVLADVAERMRERNAGCCLVWSADYCTWIDAAGLCLDGDAPPRGEPIDARDYAHLPVRTENCAVVPLPGGSVAPFLCVVRASRDYVEICPGEPMLIASLDEPVASGEENPAEGLIGLDGRLAAPARFRGCRVTEVRDDWNLYGPVQPSGAGIILRTPWPEDVRHAAETVAGRDLPEGLHRRIWNAVRPAASGTVSTGAREAA